MDITTRLALQSQATRLTGRGPGEGAFRRDGAVTLSGSVSQYRITPGATSRAHTQATIRPAKPAGFQIELFPLHSPLLRESLLVSFPPLSNMFKFGGSSCLSPALKHEFRTSSAPSSTTGLGVLLPRRIAWMLEGHMPHRFLKRSARNAHGRFYTVHFAFGKRVWTRHAPTARAGAAICVQRFDDSLNPAIHITYRVSRRSSSLREPRDPSLKGGCWIRFVCSKTGWWVWVKKKSVQSAEARVCPRRSASTYSECVFEL